MESVTHYPAKQEKAPTILVFGGNPQRRAEVVSLLKTASDLNIYAALSESSGLETLDQLVDLDLVLIGGRYDQDQRNRIREKLAQRFPLANISEPGFDYPYSNERILTDVQSKIKHKIH